MKHYTEYTMATNRLKVQKKKERKKKKGKKEDTDRTKLRRFIFPLLLLSVDLSKLYPSFFFSSLKNDGNLKIGFDPRPATLHF